MNEPWYSVKCLFHHPTRTRPGDAFLYEERITLWRASSFAEAHRMADAEARIYAEEAGCVFIQSTDSFHLFEKKISSATEVYSIMRGSNMDPGVYKNTFCITERDRVMPLKHNEKPNKSL